MTATNFDSVWRRIIHDPWKATFSAVVAILLVASVWHLYLDYLTEPLIPEDYRSAAMEVFTLNDVSFYHIKGSFNHKWVSTAINEKHVTSVFREALVGRCDQPNTSMVLDVGSNTGIYGLYAARLGCRVAMFDPQPQCQRAIWAALERNEFDANRVQLMPFAVTHNRRPIMVTNQSQCLTSLSMAEALNGRHSRRLRGAVWFSQPTHRLDQVVTPHQHVELAKVDVEGAEYSVLRSAKGLFDRRLIKTLVVEVSPPWWSSFGVTHAQVASLFVELWDLGYNTTWVLEAVHEPKRPYRIASSAQLWDFVYTYPYKQVDVLFSLDNRWNFTDKTEAH